MATSGMLRRVALVRTDVSEELSASFVRVTRICELGTTPALTSNRRTLRRNTKKYQIPNMLSANRLGCLYQELDSQNRKLVNAFIMSARQLSS
jgi:hypothetical protein